MKYQNKKITAYRITFIAGMAALALVFSYIEFLIPFFVAVPGIKLGLANLVILTALYKLGFADAAFINIVRVLAAGLLFTGMFGTLYSLAGAFLSIFVMYGLMKTGKFSVVGVSMAGGVFHNLGQLIMAALIVSTPQVFVYLPALMISGILSGAVIGTVAYAIIKRVSFPSFP
ncbi:MAG TPA: Gx transporter family protein [Bacillota bacterium]|nr:Gx transporter family protein [Bacillota bacterium]HUM56476.1 Gx transporter family protein [Bacillota bacterium]